jgi:hypothetical protein
LRRINLECNTYVHESNVRNLPVQLSLSQPAKTLGSSYYYLYSLFQKLEIRAKQFLPGSERVGREKEGAGRKGGNWEKGGEMTQTLYAHMNKR